MKTTTGRLLWVGLVLGVSLLFMFVAGEASARNPQQEWQALVDEYFEKVLFAQNPTFATLAGLHQFDSEIEDYSKQGAEAQARALHGFETRVQQFPSAGLSSIETADRQLLLGQIRSSLLTLETIRPREKNPDAYSGGATASIYVLMERKFAPPEERLKSVVAREKKIPANLAAARENLKNPPRIYAEIALRQLPGITGFFQADVPAAFSEVKGGPVKAEFAKSNAAVVEALNQYESWLKTEVLSRSNGDFRIGASNFSKKLQYEEMVDTPLDRLLQIGFDDLHKNQTELKRLAKEIDPQKTPQEVMADLGKMHPQPDKLMGTFRGTFDGLIAFIQEKKIIAIPPGPKPTLMETPPFARATTTASMDTPGPFEQVAKESYFYVTLPAPGD